MEISYWEDSFDWQDRAQCCLEKYHTSVALSEGEMWKALEIFQRKKKEDTILFFESARRANGERERERRTLKRS